jgi:hypothetical protein
MSFQIHPEPADSASIRSRSTDVATPRGSWFRLGDAGYGFYHPQTRRRSMANFLFVLSKDENEAATRCFQFAKIAHSKGHKTDVFFIDNGVTWADSGRDLNQKTPTGDCPNDYLPYLVENQVPIGV